VYDSWNIHRKRALADGEAIETLLTLEQWAAIIDYYGEVCLCCGEATELTFDHAISRSLGGTFTADNMQPLCMPCNMRKHAHHIDYRPDGGAFGRSLMAVLSQNA
jgi:5-methylcytosine-specific restriction endonuclease McrA